jgi:hypothetical protein
MGGIDVVGVEWTVGTRDIGELVVKSYAVRKLLSLSESGLATSSEKHGSVT